MDQPPQRVLVLVNPKSGIARSFSALRRVLDECWDVAGTDLHYQFSQSREDSRAKAMRAVEHGTDVILAAGGDGTVNSIASVLVGTPVKLGVLPTGSGNGFARHFGIPLEPGRAARALRTAQARPIDVGYVNDLPFFVTCGMAWDASLAKAFERYPFRGILPYVFAGAQEFLRYQPQEIRVVLDGRETVAFPDPLVFTVANLTQYGGGAIIAPEAEPDDGRLELVVSRRADVPSFLANLPRLFDGTVNQIPDIFSRSFQTLRVLRAQAGPLQIDGEAVDAGATLDVRIRPRSLMVLVPAGARAAPPR